ncbi:MAG: YihY/virulence factor BrkB family protein [Gaiellaceae bacterium]
MRVRKRSLFQKFFADRGTHLAAMIAYFALLSLVPMLFLALSLLGFAGQQNDQSRLVHALQNIFPKGSSVDSIERAVGAIQNNAATLGIIGGAVLLWSSLSLFSVLESAFNIVYGRPNRPFLRGKALALVLLVSSLLTLVVSLLAGSLGFFFMHRYAGGFFGNRFVAYPLTMLVELAGLFLFLFTVYYALTNVRLTFHDVLPGAITAAVVLTATFQVLPVYLRLVSHDLRALQALGGPAILLFWMYLMANVIVFGAEVNWWVAQRRAARARAAPTAKAPAIEDTAVIAALEPLPASEDSEVTTVSEPAPPSEDSEVTTVSEPTPPSANSEVTTAPWPLPVDPESQDSAPASSELH